MDLKALYDAVIQGDAGAVEQGVRAALEAGVPADKILSEALIPAMAEVGRLFEAQEYYVPEMLISAAAMQAGVNVLRPLLVETGAKPTGKVVLGTVKGDLHDIGKSLVGMMMEGAGFQVIDLGVDVNADRFIEAIRDGAQLIGMSAMLTTTMPNMKTIIDGIKAAGLRDRVKVIVGGAPLNQTYAEQIGADGYAPNASAAARLARELLAA